MPSTLSQTDIANMALSKVGAEAINDIADTQSTSAIECLLNWQLSVIEASRSHPWNCLLSPVVLVAQDQTPITPGTTIVSTPWAPFTAYAAGDYVTYGLALYQALIANTSTASFINDLTAAFWFETDVGNTDPFGNTGAKYPSGWAYKYALPADFILLATLNDQPLQGAEEQYEIMGLSLYTDATQAVIKYVPYVIDTTQYDALFVAALVFLLASKIATRLRQDDTSIADKMLQMYRQALRDARVKDAGERKPRRFDPVANSRFIGSRRFSTNA